MLACFLACVGERAVLGGLFRDLRFLSRASFLVSRNYLLHTMCILSVCLSVCLISQPKLGKEVPGCLDGANRGLASLGGFGMEIIT